MKYLLIIMLIMPLTLSHARIRCTPCPSDGSECSGGAACDGGCCQ